MFSVSSQKRNTKDDYDWQSRGRGFVSLILQSRVDQDQANQNEDQREHSIASYT